MNGISSLRQHPGFFFAFGSPASSRESCRFLSLVLVRVVRGVRIGPLLQRLSVQLSPSAVDLLSLTFCCAQRRTWNVVKVLCRVLLPVSSILGMRVIPCRQSKWVGKPCVDAARETIAPRRAVYNECTGYNCLASCTG